MSYQTNIGDICLCFICELFSTGPTKAKAEYPQICWKFYICPPMSDTPKNAHKPKVTGSNPVPATNAIFNRPQVGLFY
jgi:hypothetical protein